MVRGGGGVAAQACFERCERIPDTPAARPAYVLDRLRLNLRDKRRLCNAKLERRHIRTLNAAKGKGIERAGNKEPEGASKSGRIIVW